MEIRFRVRDLSTWPIIKMTFVSVSVFSNCPELYCKSATDYEK